MSPPPVSRAMSKLDAVINIKTKRLSSYQTRIGTQHSAHMEYKNDLRVMACKCYIQVTHVQENAHNQPAQRSLSMHMSTHKHKYLSSVLPNHRGKIFFDQQPYLRIFERCDNQNTTEGSCNSFMSTQPKPVRNFQQCSSV